MLSIGDFARVSDTRLRTVLSHWFDIRRGNLLPGRGDIDPGCIRASLPHVWLCEYLADTDGFRYRLAGEEVNALYGKSLAGVDLVDVLRPEAVEASMARYRQLVREPMIIHMVGKIHLTDGRKLDGERIVLPLGADGRTVDTMLGAVICDWRHNGAGTVSRETLVRTMFPVAGPGEESG